MSNYFINRIYTLRLVRQSRVPCYDNQRWLRYIPNPGGARCWEEVAKIQQQSCGDRDPKAKSNSHWDHERDLRTNVEWNIMKQLTYCQRIQRIHAEHNETCESGWIRCHFLIQNHNQSDSRNMCFFATPPKEQESLLWWSQPENPTPRWSTGCMGRSSRTLRSVNAVAVLMMWEWVTIFGFHRAQSPS